MSGIYGGGGSGGSGSGNVVGPGSSTNGDIVIFSGTTGKIIADSGVAFPIPATQGGTGLTTYTTGDILYASAANTLSKLAIGSTNQVPVVASGIPSWGDNWGRMVSLSKQTASASANISFTSFVNAAYTTYKIYFRNVLPVTDSVILRLLFSTDNGATYLNSNYQWAYTIATSSPFGGTSGSSGDSVIQLADTISNSSSRGVNGEITLYDLNSGTFAARLKGTFIHQVATFNDLTVTNNCGNNTGTTAVNAIRVQMSSGNISSGTMTLYGVIEA
jgi:hypothetical protein